MHAGRQASRQAGGHAPGSRLRAHPGLTTQGSPVHVPGPRLRAHPGSSGPAPGPRPRAHPGAQSPPGSPWLNRAHPGTAPGSRLRAHPTARPWAEPGSPGHAPGSRLRRHPGLTRARIRRVQYSTVGVVSFFCFTRAERRVAGAALSKSPAALRCPSSAALLGPPHLRRCAAPPPRRCWALLTCGAALPLRRGAARPSSPAAPLPVLCHLSSRRRGSAPSRPCACITPWAWLGAVPSMCMHQSVESKVWGGCSRRTTTSPLVNLVGFVA